MTLTSESKRLLDTAFPNGEGWLIPGHYNSKDKLMVGKEGPVGSFAINDADDLYFCVGTVLGSRTKVRRVYVLVIDDVGKEINRDAFDDFFPLDPSYVVESSPGSFQYGYFIDGGMDPEEFKALRQAMKASPEWGAAHNIGAGAIYRLPQGTHTKAKYKGWKVRLEAWTGKLHTVEQIWTAAPAGAVRVAPPKKRFEWNLGDQALQELVDLIPNPLGLARREWVRIAYGILGAGGDLEIFDSFSNRWEGGIDTHETERVWNTLDAPMSGGGLLREEAEKADKKAFEVWRLTWEPRGAFDDGADLAEAAAAALPAGVVLGTQHFVAFLPLKKYVYLPTGDMWPKETINSVIPPVVVGIKADGSPRTMPAATWLDNNSPVTQMSWLPGKGRVVAKSIVTSAGLEHDPTSAVYNSYRGPAVEAGEAAKAKPWLDHVRALYPGDADHMFDFFAHAVQKPWEKVNHGLLLGGAPGIGKDTLLHPVLKAVGYWNTTNISPSRIRESFNGFIKSVVLVIDEIRDLGDVNQWSFYEQTKTLLASPPLTLQVNEKFKPAYAVPNVVHVVMTTNSKCDGLYLPDDDRRHYVAWSDAAGTGDASCQPQSYFRGLWGWMNGKGCGHVAAWLRERDISKFDPAAPPFRTAAFKAIVSANRPASEDHMETALDAMARPDAFTLDWLAAASSGELGGMLAEHKYRRHIPRWLEKEGYEAFPNPSAKSGLWVIGGVKQMVYVARKLLHSERIKAVAALEAARQAAMDAIFKAGGGP
jgi:hypothetical protein